MQHLLRYAGFVLLIALFLTACSTQSGPDASFETQASPGLTEAPDLIEVGNFRPGPANDDGNPQTLVDYTFDQAAYLNGGDRSSFHLVPLDASDALDARGVAPEGDAEGDDTVTVLYSGELSPEDFARGYLDSGIVNSAADNVSAQNPANINQSADISPSVLTENPDLVEVERESDQALLFVFDEALTTDDVVQNTGGLRVYFAEATGNSTLPDAGATRVERAGPETLRAFYTDLPGGRTLADAVGAFAVQGAVQAAQGSRGGNDGANAFDEVDIAADPLEGLTCDGVAVTLRGSGTIVGTNGQDVILGSDGSDTIEGRGGDDIICAGAGADTVRGQGGNDTIFGEGGNDERLDGGSGDDFVSGGAGDDLVVGGSGNDTLEGGAGSDTLRGNRGDDKLSGGAGDDTLSGGANNDELSGGSGNDTLRGQAGDDILNGNDGNDTLRGGANNDILSGNDGNDTLRGQSGDDILSAGAGDDELFGGAGNDILDGGAGNDRADGGAGGNNCRAEVTTNCR